TDSGTLDACGLGIITRTWKATDCAGNFSTCVQKITVQDITKPVITCPVDVSFECDAVGSNFGTATATDNCDANPKVTFSDVKTADCGNTYHIDRTWTAVDCAGNKATCLQKIKVVDTTAPTLTCVAPKTIECNATFNFDPPTVKDNCDANPTVTFADKDNADGSKTRTWTAKDICGNTSTSCSQTISVSPCAHIFPTQTTCCNFSTGTVTQLSQVCYTASSPSNGQVTNAIPGVFFYYSNVVAPAANFTINVTQSNDGDLNKLFSVQNVSNIRLFTQGCGTNVNFTASIVGGSEAKLVVTGATVGATYIISVKYDVKSIIGATIAGANPASTYTFKSFTKVGANAAVLVTGSTGIIDAVSGCSDNTPLPGDCTLPTAIAPSTINKAPAIEAKIGSVGFDAYPVPFKDQLTIRYKFDYVSDVKIEVFNAQGILVLSKTDTNSYLNKEIALSLKANKGQEQVYVVKVTTDRGSSTKKVISSR
ncbi:T9SS type A sorting domain-containing protein, partial [Flavobacterium sp. GB2R13]|uniref:T9SS type A sorting domain-containing protein n=1 Tax=Flavobacterium algoris TaxID=3398733 RepID=UPI003A88292A